MLFFGAGTAGVGIANLIAKSLTMLGISEDEARQHCWLFDINGLVQSQRTDLADFQQPLLISMHPLIILSKRFVN